VLVLVALGHLVLGVVTARGLYADGAYYLLRILEGHGFFLFDPARVFAQFLTQIPPVAGLALGIGDVTVLTRLHSFGLLAVPLAGWAIAVAAQWRGPHRAGVLAAAALGFLGSGFVVVGEYVVLYAFATAAFAILTRDRITRGWAIVLLLTGVLLLRSYEGIAYFGPVLAAVALLRLRRVRAERPQEVPVLAASAALSAVATLFGAISIAFPRDPNNRAGAGALLEAALADPRLVIASVLAAVAILVLPRVPGRGRLLAVALGALAAASLALPWAAVPPWMHYQSRTVAGLAVAGVLVVMALDEALWRRARVGAPAGAPGGERARPEGLGGALVPLALLLALSVPFTALSLGWVRWGSVVETEVRSGTGVVAYETVAIPPELAAFTWPWTNPSLTTVLAGGEPGRTILAPAGQLGSDPAAVPAPLDAGYHRGTPVFP